MSPVKEPHFLALDGKRADFSGPGNAMGRRGITTIEANRTLFQGVSNELAIGEASSSYLYDEEAPGQIRHYVPRVKLIAILRNPVERAYSNFST